MTDIQSDIINVYCPKIIGSISFCYVKNNSPTREGEIIYDIQNQDNNIVHITSPCYGTISKLFFKKGDTINNNDDSNNIILATITKCFHELLYENSCLTCGKIIDTLISDEYNHNFIDGNNVSFKHDIYNKIDRENEQKYLEQKKLVLCCDLDNTLLEATSDIRLYNTISIYKPNDVHDICTYTNNTYVHYFIKIRPYVCEFLQFITKYYELYIYSQGSREYIKECLKFIDPNGDLFEDRIIARGETHGTVQNGYKNIRYKDMTGIYRCFQYLGVAIDDSINAWLPEVKDQVLQIEGYYFWKQYQDIVIRIDKDIAAFMQLQSNIHKKTIDSTIQNVTETEDENYIRELEEKEARELYGITMNQSISNIPKESSVDKENETKSDEKQIILQKRIDLYKKYSTNIDKDKSLSFVQTKLVLLYHLFYKDDYFDNESNREIQLNTHSISLSSIIKQYNETLLSGYVFTFSRIFPVNIDQTQTSLWKSIEFYGGQCSKDLTESTTHLITSTNGTQKVKQACSMPIYIVTLQFIEDILKYHVRVDESNYIVKGLSSVCPGKIQLKDDQNTIKSSNTQNTSINNENIIIKRNQDDTSIDLLNKRRNCDSVKNNDTLV